MTSHSTTRRMFLRMSATGLSILAIRPARVAADDEAAALLQNAAKAMTEVTSFHFEMETIDGRATVLENLELSKVVGDVLRPDSFTATLTAKLAVIEVNVDVVSVAGSVWVTDPTKPGKVWRQVASAGERGGGAAFTDLINPDRLFLAAVTLIEDPVVDGKEKIDGQECSVVTGTFDPTIAGVGQSGRRRGSHADLAHRRTCLPHGLDRRRWQNPAHRGRRTADHHRIEGCGQSDQFYELRCPARDFRPRVNAGGNARSGAGRGRPFDLVDIRAVDNRL